jgi:hypothetical protein
MSQLFILSSSLSRHIGWPPPARRLLVLLAIVLAAVASVAAGPTAPASASVTFTASYVYLPLNLPVTVTPGDAYQTIPAGTFFMQAGETRRVNEQLDVSINADNGAEIDNEIFCAQSDANGVLGPELNRASAGTNNEGVAGQHLVWRLSMLIQVLQPTYVTCGIQLQTSTGHADQDNYVMTVWPVETTDAFNGTWMQVSSENQVGAQEMDYSTFHGGNCAPADNPGPGDAPCQYVGGVGYVNGIAVSGPINPPVADILNHPIEDRWTAASDAFNVDAVGTLQLTSCPYASSSCNPADWGYASTATAASYLELDQLNPDGSVCQVNRAFGWSLGQTTDNFTITNDAHHEPISYDLTAPVSPNCGGSRVFQLDLRVQWLSGNAIKIDGGNVNVINSVRGTTTPATTTVPGVVRHTEAQADGAIQAAGLSVETTYVVSTQPVNTVLSQSPAVGTIVQVGSPVQIVVSLGHPVV